MLMHFTRYFAMIAVFMHSLLCGNVCCCALTCSTKDDAASVSHVFTASACSCHSEKHDHEAGHINHGSSDPNHHCDHQHHFCQCLHSAIPNNGTDFRMVLNSNLFSLSFAFLSTTGVTPIPVLNLRTPETMDDSSAIVVRLHLLLEHFLI